MTETDQGTAFQTSPHSHVFLGPDHARAERSARHRWLRPCIGNHRVTCFWLRLSKQAARNH